ncbi:MAG: FtsX-like permease family protein [Cytophagales bacterium]|nr:FtsX-like permease family protein [Cytophagales bacterium]
MEPTPPKMADWFLDRICKDHLLEEIMGDLLQQYYMEIEARGKFRATLNYWFQAFHFIRPFALKKSQNSNHIIMLRYNLLLALRNLSKQKFYSIINISGLALAAVACLLISIFIVDELNYDKHFPNHENIYRVNSHIFFNDMDMKFATSPAPMKDMLKKDFPEVAVSGRLRDAGPILLEKGDQFLEQEDVAWADPEILDIFQLEFIYGGDKNTLVEAESMILSESAARKFFGEENPVGQTIRSTSDQLFRIDGVYKDIPYNSHFHFHVFKSMEGLEHSKNQIWLSNNYKNYVLLEDQTNVSEFNQKLPEALKVYIGPRLQQMAGISYDDFTAGGGFMRYEMVPMTSIHLHSHRQFEIEPNSSIDNIYIFIAVGVMILLLAAFNFMNLSTARSANRAKEVGIRKVMGSLKRSLMGQFLTESIVISLFGFAIAVGVVYLSLPFLNDFTDKEIINPFFGDMILWPYVLLASLLIGLAAGIYPAFILSSFSPNKVLKGRLALGAKSSIFRNVLVVFQFSISIIMILGTSIVYKQLLYNQNKNLGYDRNKVMILENTYTMGTGIEAFINSLKADPDISNVTTSYFLPTRDTRSDHTFNREEDNTAENAVNMQTWRIDDQYIPTLGMKVIDGRNFDRNFAGDSAAVILNQTAVEIFGMGDDPVGKKIKYVGDQNKLQVVGVVEDFYFDTFKQKVRPLIFFMNGETTSIALKYISDNPIALVDRIEQVWNEHNAGQPFEFTFMDQEFNANFNEDRKLGTILGFFAVLAIVIACLGLFALAAYTAQQRRKEISIRKVLGASISGIMGLLFSSFSKLLGISALISLPVGYYLIDQWLSNFAYRTNIGAVVFIAAGLIVFVIAWVTVGTQTLRAAKSNPAEILHNE